LRTDIRSGGGTGHSQAQQYIRLRTMRQIITGCCILVLGPFLLWMALLHIGDSDPLGYYEVLGLPQGVPHLVTKENIVEAHKEIVSKLTQSLKLCSATNSCAPLEDSLSLVNKAAQVLLEPKTRKAYDFPEVQDHYEVLGVRPDDDVSVMRVAYESKTAAINSEFELLGCEDNETVRCIELDAQRRAVRQAAIILGNENNLRVYTGQDETQSLSFVSSPLKLVGKNPLSYLGPVVVLVLVLYYIRVVEPRNSQFHEAEVPLEEAVAKQD